MIAITNLAKALGPRTLFEKASFNLNSPDCYGLVGANGSGKSTFLRILAGVEAASDGQISIPKKLKIGFLNQDQFLDDHLPIIECAMMGDEAVFTAIKRLDSLQDSDDISDLQTFVQLHGGYTLRSRAAEILEGLGIAGQVHDNPVSTLSGGFKLRALLARLLVGAPDLLLLDEPTNHLDIISIRWLEKFLAKFEGCALVISHDLRFLENVCTRILDIDYDTITPYVGGYTSFETQKQERRVQLEKEIAGIEREIAHKQSYVDRFGAKASKARQAQSRLKQIEKIEIPALPKSSRKFPKFSFKSKRASGREVLKVDGVSKSFGDKRVLQNISFNLMRNDRVAVIGPNGIGKSTLIKLLVNELKAEAGTFAWGYETYPAYFSQSKKWMTERDRTVEEWLQQFCPGSSQTFLRSQLGHVMFSADEAKKNISVLSGGELARLDLAHIILAEPNVLLLDEPTNHLDVEAIQALASALKTYDGTVVFVSHDRWFVSELATRILELKPSGVNDYKGTFAEYLASCGDDHLDSNIAVKRVKESAPAGNNDYADAKKRRSAQQKVESQIAKIQKEIENAEKRLSEIAELFCEPTFFKDSEPQRVRDLQEEKQDLEQKNQRLFDEWSQLESSQPLASL